MGIPDLTPTIIAITDRADANRKRRRASATGNNRSEDLIPNGVSIQLVPDEDVDPDLPPERPGDGESGGQELSPPLIENISIVQTLVQPNISSATVKVSVDIIIDEDGEKYEVNWVTA